VATPADIERDLFGSAPKVFCDLAFSDGAPAGFALWYHTYSTFQGRHGIWLEDLFVTEVRRGLGIGRALLAHLARRCVEENLGRFEWAVLDWNQPSIDFYKSQGATFMDDWRRCRVSGEALLRLGGA
jgi:GNAT superfamily N-acetyltransferase